MTFGLFYILVVKNNAAIDIVYKKYVYIIWGEHIFIFIIDKFLGVELLGVYGNSMLNILRSGQIVFQGPVPFSV